MKSVNVWCEAIKNAAIEEGRTSKGDPIYRTHCSTERYYVDFADDFTAEGWEQYDTDQDAHYFGVWVNSTTLQVLTYAEGDWSLVCCRSVPAYNAEIRSMNEFYGEGFICKAYGQGDNGAWTKHTLVQDRQRFFIEG